MKTGSLYRRIALIFALVLLAFGSALGGLSYRAAKDHQHEVMQQLSRELAQHIADHLALLTSDRNQVEELFRMATVVNPTIELYLLDADGAILSHSPPEGPLARERVSLAPIRDFLGGRSLPILGDSPRSAERQGVFSAAPILRDGYTAGYLYVVLAGAMYQQRADDASLSYVLRTTAWTGIATLLLALLVGLALFALITRRLNRLISSVQAFESASLGDHRPLATTNADAGTDEIGRLSMAFEHLTGQLAAQRAELQRQHELRRELVANVSHDLRTPLTLMQSHLETLVRIGEKLSPADRQQYLDVAVRQSHRVARLSQQLFELAQLEGEESLPESELFSLAELVQDIVQKFALSARDKGVQLLASASQRGLFVRGDIGLIERVISNLIDNAIRHTPSGGLVRLDAMPGARGAEVRVTDTGTGIAAQHLPGLFERDSPLRKSTGRGHGGLGLLIAKRILALHGTSMSVQSEAGRGTVFSFMLPAGTSDGDASENVNVNVNELSPIQLANASMLATIETTNPAGS